MIRKDDPTTLYYHVTVPAEDAEADAASSLALTAVSQVMCMCIMAFQSKQRDARWHIAAKKKLHRHQIDYESLLRQISENQRKMTPSIPYREGRKPMLKSSPYLLRPRRERSSSPDDEPGQSRGPADSSNLFHRERASARVLDLHG
jgi:hypothetical protein